MNGNFTAVPHFQNFTTRSSHNLKTSDLHRETDEKKFIHAGSVKKNLNKTCPKRKTHSLKIGCEANFRVNFDLKLHNFRISQFQPVHAQHEINQNLYDHYSNTRKPANKDLDEKREHFAFRALNEVRRTRKPLRVFEA